MTYATKRVSSARATVNQIPLNHRAELGFVLQDNAVAYQQQIGSAAQPALSILRLPLGTSCQS